MSETSEQTTPKKKRAPKADAKVFTRSCRRTLKLTPSDSADPWVDILNVKLYEIARHPESSQSLRLQAIKTAIALCGDQPIDMTKPKHDEVESRVTRNSLSPTPEEEALSEAELDAQIAELQGCLGSVSIGDV